MNSTLNVDSNTTLGGTLTVANNTEINGTLDVDANFAVRSGTTDKMTVASSTGNIATDGTLVVQGQTTINDSIILNAANEEFAVQNGSGVDKFTVDSDNGNTVIGLNNAGTGTLTVHGAVDFNTTLDVDGAVTLNSTLDVDDDAVFHNDITLDTTGKIFKITNGSADKFTVQSTSGSTDIRGTLDVGGAVVLESTLQVDGNITLGNAASDTLTINSDTFPTAHLQRRLHWRRKRRRVEKYSAYS